MLRAGFFPDFKGNETLLVWGDNAGMAQLRAGLLDVRWDRGDRFDIEGVPGRPYLAITGTKRLGVSVLIEDEESFSWLCSPHTLDDAIYLTLPLLTSASGHQYVDVEGGLAEVIMIAVNEYPDDFPIKFR